MASVATLRDLVGALIETCLEENKIGDVTKDLEKFYSLVDKHEQIKNIFSTSVYKINEKTGILKDLSEKLNLDPYTVNFISTVLEIDRFKPMIQSKELILRSLRKASGKEKAELIFAKEPSSGDIENIKKSIEKKIGNEVDIEVRVDPEIFGGVIVKVANKLFDNSIKSQLNNIKNILTAS